MPRRRPRRRSFDNGLPDLFRKGWSPETGLTGHQWRQKLNTWSREHPGALDLRQQLDLLHTAPRRSSEEFLADTTRTQENLSTRAHTEDLAKALNAADCYIPPPEDIGDEAAPLR